MHLSRRRVYRKVEQARLPDAGERVLAAYALMELWEEHPESLAHVEVICRK